MAEEERPEFIQEFQKTFAWVNKSIIMEQVKKRKDVIDALNEIGTIKVKIGLQEKPFLQSKKFWGGVIALAILIGDQYTGVDLWMVALPALVYIFGQGLADLGKNKPTP